MMKYACKFDIVWRVFGGQAKSMLYTSSLEYGERYPQKSHLGAFPVYGMVRLMSGVGGWGWGLDSSKRGGAHVLSKCLTMYTDDVIRGLSRNKRYCLAQQSIQVA